MAALISEVMGRSIAIDCDEERVRPEGERNRPAVAANARPNGWTGWQPEFADRDGLARGLQMTADWFRDGGRTGALSERTIWPVNYCCSVGHNLLLRPGQ